MRSESPSSDNVPLQVSFPDGRVLPLDRPRLMGILNVTPDSFSDGGVHTDIGAAVAHALRMESEGADIIDVGGESSRPGADPILSEIEQQRAIPVIRELRRQSDVLISIDTYHADTARAALEAGANMVNDITAMRGEETMAEVVAEAGCPIILMHMRGTPKTMQTETHYDDVLRELDSFFAERVRFATSQGLRREQLLFDPGIGFGKDLEDNVRLIQGITSFDRSCCGLTAVLGVSRKSFIQKIYPSDRPASARLGGSIAPLLFTIERFSPHTKHRIYRVHDVHESAEALAVWMKIGEFIPCPGYTEVMSDV